MDTATSPRYSLLFSAIVLALGAVIAAAVLGGQFRSIGSGRQSISVKGLAERPVRADQAEWTVSVSVKGATFPETLGKVRKEMPELRNFLEAQGLSGAALVETSESITPNMEQEETPSGHWRTAQKGFNGSHGFVVTVKDLDLVAKARKAAVQFKADGHSIEYADPQYLVSVLEQVKMSLIGAATRDARARAEEFAKNGGVKAGRMRSASQGAFNILAPGAGADVSEYGGTYDKTTVDKVARVVVTIEYAIEP
jgi:uncharacterized protein